MKLSFSTQNWSALTWNEFCAVASEVRLQGIEICDVRSSAFTGKNSPANPELAAATRRRLIQQKLSIPCVDTLSDFTDPAFPGELAESLQLAVNLGIPYVGITVTDGLVSKDSGFRYRAFVRSITVTLGSFLSFQSSWPYPTSME